MSRSAFMEAAQAAADAAEKVIRHYYEAGATSKPNPTIPR